MKKHRLSFGTFEEAIHAELAVPGVVSVEDGFLHNDGDSQAIEYHFLTVGELGMRDQKAVRSATRPDAHGFNEEDDGE